MPELPEVETIRRGLLAAGLVGRRIASVQALLRASAQGDVQAACRPAPGRAIADLRRRGKLLLIDLSPPLVLAFHLRMTGRLLLAGPHALPGPHTRLVFALDDGRRLHFDDARTFGRCRAASPEELMRWPYYASLGPEPLDLDGPGFLARLTGRRGRIKSLLLAQRVLAGIGNIYADESLFRAGIRPDADVRNLSEARLLALGSAVRAVLAEAIEGCGSSIRDFRDGHGRKGDFQNRLQVYGRAGEPCPACGRRLRALKVGGRTSTFCPGCQRP